MAAADATLDLPGATLLPGLIEGHSHVLLHPYKETSWNDQVLRESLGLRTARAINHLRATLEAGFTAIRDLGTEGAGYADVELKQAIEQGIISGPRMLQNRLFVDFKAEIFGKSGSSTWVKLGEFPIQRQLLAKQ